MYLKCMARASQAQLQKSTETGRNARLPPTLRGDPKRVEEGVHPYHSIVRTPYYLTPGAAPPLPRFRGRLSTANDPPPTELKCVDGPIAVWTSTRYVRISYIQNIGLRVISTKR